MLWFLISIQLHNSNKLKLVNKWQNDSKRIPWWGRHDRLLSSKFQMKLPWQILSFVDRLDYLRLCDQQDVKFQRKAICAVGFVIKAKVNCSWKVGIRPLWNENASNLLDIQISNQGLFTLLQLLIRLCTWKLYWNWNYKMIKRSNTKFEEQ